MVTGCVHDSRSLFTKPSDERDHPSSLRTRTWGLCSLIGPSDPNPGIYGTDLGYTTHPKAAERVTVLFGDTWAKPIEACQHPMPVSDDFQGSLPMQRPERFKGASPVQDPTASCDLVQYSLRDPHDITSWPRLRLFPSATAQGPDTIMDTGGLRTPVAAFSDGERVYSIILRGDPTYCEHTADCPNEMACSADASEPRLHLGECSRAGDSATDAAPAYCRRDSDCAAGGCGTASRGVCVARAPFSIPTPKAAVSPDWYREDPRRGISRTMYVAGAVWPDRPSDYAVLARFETNRFQNIAARTIAHFDERHPESNDYRPGYHTLLVWGRSSFVAYDGAQALPFLLHVPLSQLRSGSPSFKPRFFAGASEAGVPRWSDTESEAQPIYGVPAASLDGARPTLVWPEPEFDYVAQMTVSYVAPLERWVMLYGGDLPAFLVLDPATGKARPQTYLQWSPGAIHMRSAAHPWGGHGREHAWSSAEPIYTRRQAARYLACPQGGPEALPGCVKEPDPSSPLELAAAITGMSDTKHELTSDAAAQCMKGEIVYRAQQILSGDPVGRMYAPNIIEEWTEDVSHTSQGASRSADIYWNVSTWSPYRVALVKTRLTAR